MSTTFKDVLTRILSMIVNLFNKKEEKNPAEKIDIKKPEVKPAEKEAETVNNTEKEEKKEVIDVEKKEKEAEKEPEVKEVIKQILAHSSNYQAGRTKKIEYLVIHYTANKGDKAENNCKYFQGANRNASAHYFVDENNIYQSVLDENTAWSVGGSKYANTEPLFFSICTNANSISIELCNFLTYNEAVANKAFGLIRELKAKYNIPIDKIIRHYDVNGKPCPLPLKEDGEWLKFKNKI